MVKRFSGCVPSITFSVKLGIDRCGYKMGSDACP